ncbi:MAG: phosphorylase, partial [Gemmatimonadota bacterium]|nr:phosphorylase [Gemmatimonadota bacterium]
MRSLRTLLIAAALPALVPILGHAQSARSLAERAARGASTPRIAVMSAFETELVALRAAATITSTQVVNGRTWTLGTLAGQEVVLLLSGYSMVNAAMTTQALL